MTEQEKKITLIHDESRLSNDTYPAKFRKYVENGVRKRHIDLVLGEFVDTFLGSDSGELILRSGKKITTDCVVCSLSVSVPITPVERFGRLVQNQIPISLPSHLGMMF